MDSHMVCCEALPEKSIKVMPFSSWESNGNRKQWSSFLKVVVSTIHHHPESSSAGGCADSS
eukprot:scaffold344983_cov56-Attheya_sp.AAC.2